MANYLLWIGIGLAALGFIFGKKFLLKNVTKTTRLWTGLIGIALVLSSFGLFNQLPVVGGFFSGLSSISATSGTLPTFTSAPITQTTVSGGTLTVAAEKTPKVVSTLTVLGREKYSNSETALGNASAGYLRFYLSGTSPKSSTISALDSVNVSGGSGVSTVGRLLTETPYEALFDGNGVWYDLDLTDKVHLFTANLDSNSQYVYRLNDIGRIGSIDTGLFLNFQSASNNVSINGQTSQSGGQEIGYNAANTTLNYSDGAGDGQFFLDFDISFLGLNREVRKPVFCFVFDTSNPPEGNEITSINAQWLSGQNFNIPVELKDYWSQQQCIPIGESFPSGTRGQFRLTFSVEEANTDAGADTFNFVLDDLGGDRTKDVLISNSGMPRISRGLDFQA